MSDEENVYEYQVPHTSEDQLGLFPGSAGLSFAKLLKKAQDTPPVILPESEQVEFSDNTNIHSGYMQVDGDIEPAYPTYPDYSGPNYASIGVSHDDLSDMLANVQNNMDALHKDVQKIWTAVSAIYDHLAGLGDASST